MVQRLARPEKAGHAGTLDPLATGVLIVCVGQATRLIGYVQRMPKHYVGTFLLGRRSPTEDIDGDVELLSGPPVPALEQLEAAARQFVGRTQQRPPAYSALKVAGRRSYDLARRGEDVQLQPRPIEVYSLAVTRYEYPELVLEIECSGGTYIRSLGRDLAETLGTSAVMSALVRDGDRPLASGRCGRSPRIGRRRFARQLGAAPQGSRRFAGSRSFGRGNRPAAARTPHREQWVLRRRRSGRN